MERVTGMEQQETFWFRNDSLGHQGAVKFNAEGRREAVSVPPGGTIELSEDEMKLTASAPGSAEHNPLVAGGPDGGPAFVKIDQGVERPIRPPVPEEQAAEVEETAAAPEGSRDAREEVGTPPA